MEILRWLQAQDYWVELEEFRKRMPFEELELKGITMKKGEEGQTLIPRRDLRKLVKRKV
jgi:hypothetical protein